MLEISKKKKATVLNLYENYSWSTDTIAEKLNMEKSMVEAIINGR
jgi:predicted transcriptional regulator